MQQRLLPPTGKHWRIPCAAQGLGEKNQPLERSVDGLRRWSCYRAETLWRVAVVVALPSGNATSRTMLRCGIGAENIATRRGANP